MSQPLSPTSQSFDTLDLKSLAQETNKTFQRLAPYSQLQDPSSPDAVSTLNQIVRKIGQHLEAVDASIAAVQFLYRLSKDAVAFFSTGPCTEVPPGTEKENTTPKGEANGATSSSSLGHPAFKVPDRKARIDGLTLLADDALKNAQKASEAFVHIDQDLFKIAASTKDMPVESTVNIPVDLSSPNMITKPFRDIGPDLVSSLNLLSYFSRHLIDLTNWCTWIKSDIVTQSDPSNILAPDEMSKKWNKVLADCLVYHNMIAELQERHSNLLPVSTVSWQNVAEEKKAERNAKRRSSNGSGSRRSGPTKRVGRFLKGVLRYLTCRGGMSD